MHSIRMRTVCSSSHVYPSMHWEGRVGVYVSQHALGRGLFAEGVFAQIRLPGGGLPWGCIPACTEADSPP